MPTDNITFEIKIVPADCSIIVFKGTNQFLCVMYSHDRIFFFY